MTHKVRWAILAATVTSVAAAAVAFIVHEKRTEHPPYVVERSDGSIDLRRYPALLVAETETDGRRDVALNRGFGRLANYIFAKDREGEAIAMTAPVLSNREGIYWRTRFVMPAKYRRETLPLPGRGVTIATLPPQRVTSYRFSGTATDEALANAEAALRAWLTKNRFDAGAVSYAFYNSPFMPSPLRRNEVLITISERSSSDVR